MSYYIKIESAKDLKSKMEMLWAAGIKPHSIPGKNNPTIEEFISSYGKSVKEICVPNDGKYGFNYTVNHIYYNTVGEVIDIFYKKVIPVVFPDAAKYKITYRKSNGEHKEYTISNPIEADQFKMTCYAFGKGVRSFIKANVISLEKI